MAKLVAIGDSLVQGAMSMAVSDTRNSFPAIVAKCMGIESDAFKSPDFSLKGGIPFNFEWMARKLEAKFGNTIGLIEWPGAVIEIVKMLDEVENYYERGRGSDSVDDCLYHNLGVFGFQVGDTFSITSRYANKKITNKDDWFQPPSHGWLRLAARVLNPANLSSRQDDTIFDAAKRIKDQDGEIENLLVCLGSNNCLNSVFQLKIHETGPKSPGVDSGYTLWSATAFEEEYVKMCNEIDRLGALHVFISTIPNVLHMPLLQGFNRGETKRKHNDFFDYYSKFWMDKKKFNSKKDLFLSAKDAQKISTRVLQYNSIIRNQAKIRGYKLVELGNFLDSLNDSKGVPAVSLPASISDLDTRFFKTNSSGKIVQGGLLSLDGMHPTVCGYGVIAQLFINEIRKTGQDVFDVNFNQLRKEDVLVSNPPKTLNSLIKVLMLLEKRFRFSRWIRLSINDGIILNPSQIIEPIK